MVGAPPPNGSTSDRLAPSDLSGLVYIELDSAGAWKRELAREMRAAGLDPNLNRAG